MTADISFQQVSGDIWFEGTPSICQSSPDKTDVFVCGKEGKIWHTSWYTRGTQKWTEWESLDGATAKGNVTAVAGSDLHLYVFIRNENNRLMVTQYDGVIWKGWRSLGPNLIAYSDVTAVTSGGGALPVRFDLFVRTSENKIAHMVIKESVQWFDAFGPWANIGPDCSVLGNPQGILFSDGGPYQVHVWTRNQQGQILHRWFLLDTGEWAPWSNRGGTVVNDPIVVSWAPSQMEIIARGPHNQFCHSFYNSSDGTGWHDWKYYENDISGPIISAVCIRSFEIAVVAQGPDNKCIWKRMGADRKWTSWQSPVKSELYISDAPVIGKTRETRIFARSSSGTLLECKLA